MSPHHVLFSTNDLLQWKSFVHQSREKGEKREREKYRENHLIQRCRCSSKTGNLVCFPVSDLPTVPYPSPSPSSLLPSPCCFWILTYWLVAGKKKKTKLKCPFLHHLYFPRCLWKTPTFWRTRVMNSQCTFTNPLASSWEERVPKPVSHTHRDHSEAPCPLPSPWAELSKFAKYLPSAVFTSVTCSLRKRNISFISVFLLPRTQVLTIAL